MIKSYKLRRGIANTLIYILLAVLGFIWICPFIYLLMHSFRAEGVTVVNYIIPKQWTFQNYIDLFTGGGTLNFTKWFVNTFVVACFSCVISTISVLMVSYAFSRLRFKLVDTDNSIKAAGGLIIQMMPDAKEEDIVKIEQIVANMKHISSYVLEKESLEAILEELFGDDLQILSKQDICFKCDCDKAKMKRALTTLSKEERMAMIEEDHGCEITCNFCNERYQFSEEELRDLERFIDTYAKA